MSMIEALEQRLLLANQFVGQQFSWGSATPQPDVSLIGLASHPNGFLAVTRSGSSSQLILSDSAGATIGTPVEIHPGEDITGLGTRPLSSSALGTSVVAWIGKKVVSGIYDRASFRLFDAAGQPQTGVIRVHAMAVNDYSIDADMASDGRFVITWTAGQVIYARTFSASGGNVSAVLTITNGADFARVAALAGGDFEIVWQSQNPQFRLFRQRFSATGVALTSPTAIPAPFGTYDLIGDIEADSLGRTVIAWVRQRTDLPDSVYMRGYDVNSQPLSVPALVTDSVSFRGSGASLSLDDTGRAVITWKTLDGPIGVYTDGIAARQMNINGQPIGAEFLVNTFQDGDQIGSFVAAKPGSFAVGWSGPGPSQPASSAWGQMFDDAGTAADLAPSASFEFAGVGTFNAPCPIGSSCTYHQSVNISFNSSFGWTLRKSPPIINRSTGQPLSDLLFWFYSADRKQINIGPVPWVTNSFPDGNYQLSLNRMDFGDAAGNPMASDLQLNFFALKGDLNRDRQVSIADFITLSSNFGKTNATYADGDINYDGEVSIADFIDLAASFGASLPAPASAPQAPAAESVSLTSPATELLQQNDRETKKRRSPSPDWRKPHRLHHRRRPILQRH